MSVGVDALLNPYALAHVQACKVGVVLGAKHLFMMVAAAVIVVATMAVVLAVVMVMLSSLTRTAMASDAAGWRWYNEPFLAKEPLKKTPPSVTSVTLTRTRTLSPTEQLRSFKRYFDDTLNDAVINPTNTNKVEKSMRLNQYVSEQSSLYGMTFKKVLLANPGLSYTKDHPTEQAARRPYLLLQRSQKVRAVRRLAQAGWGLFFVYKGREAIDKALAPSVQQFADQHGIDLLGVSLDGQALDSIHHTRQNQQHLTVPFSPALVLVNPATGEMKPLAYGFISQADLLGRFLNVATDFAPDF